jgi:hypothetical protein
MTALVHQVRIGNDKHARSWLRGSTMVRTLAMRAMAMQVRLPGKVARRVVVPLVGGLDHPVDGVDLRGAVRLVIVLRVGQGWTLRRGYSRKAIGRIRRDPEK